MKSAVWHPFTQHGLREPIIPVERTAGVALYTADGRRIIDAISSWWVTTHGHAHPAIISAIQQAAETLDQVIFAGFTHEPADGLATELLDLLSMPVAHVFFTDSGSTSVEVALKMALSARRNRSDPRYRIAVLEHSYHGDTIGAMSVGARGVFNQAYEPILFEVSRLPFPKDGREQDTLDALEKLCRSEDPPAALIVEPLILGAGGMRTYKPNALRSMREVCTAYGVTFIVDEIMTGWGRTGTLLAIEQAGITPDILCLSKGLTGGSLPLAATLASTEIFEAHYSTDPSQQFFHSSSYTANPIACAAALANVRIWKEEPVLERVASLAARQEDRASRLRKADDVRQLGTIVAFEMDGRDGRYLSELGSKLRSFFLERDVLLRPLGNTIYVMPPYCIDDTDIDRVYEVIDEAIQVYGQGHR